MGIGTLGIAALVAPCLGAPSQAETPRFAFVANGKVALTAERQGRRVALDYQASNNGRGPKLGEQIELHAAGFPIRWGSSSQSISGRAAQPAPTTGNRGADAGPEGSRPGGRSRRRLRRGPDTENRSKGGSHGELRV